MPVKKIIIICFTTHLLVQESVGYMGYTGFFQNNDSGSGFLRNFDFGMGSGQTVSMGTVSGFPISSGYGLREQQEKWARVAGRCIKLVLGVGKHSHHIRKVIYAFGIH